MIIFFSMDGCGFCAKSKQLLKDHIASGKIKMADAKDAPEGVRGFPYFESTETGKSHTGMPRSASELMDKLGTGACKKEGQMCSKHFECCPGMKCHGNKCRISPNVQPGPRPPAPGMPGGPCILPPNSGILPPGVTGVCNAGSVCNANTGQCILSPPNNPNPGPGPSPGSKLTGGDIAGIVIGSVAGLVLLILLGMLIMKSGKKKRGKSPK